MIVDTRVIIALHRKVHLTDLYQCAWFSCSSKDNGDWFILLKQLHYFSSHPTSLRLDSDAAYDAQDKLGILIKTYFIFFLRIALNCNKK